METSQPTVSFGLDHEVVEANRGNYMVAGGELVAIDNDMPIRSEPTGLDIDFETAKLHRVSQNAIDDIIDRRPFLVIRNSKKSSRNIFKRLSGRSIP
jgi:hypothetical protein